MNSNATKKQIELPFQYNFCKDRPHVDNTLRNAEEINAPFLNDMMQPLYVKSYENKAVHDRAGNRYTIENGSFQKNGNELWSVNEQKFVKEDITEEMKDWIAFDLHNGSIEGGLKFINTDADQVNHYKLYYTNDDSVDIATSGTLVSARCRWIGDDLITVLITVSLVAYNLTIYRNGTQSYSDQIHWRTYTGLANYRLYNGNIKNLPKIHIGKINTYFGVSITVCSGTVTEATDYNCFWTGLLEENDTTWLIIGQNLTPTPNGSLGGVVMVDSVTSNTYSSTSTTTVTYFAVPKGGGGYTIYNYSSSASRLSDLVSTSLSFGDAYIAEHTVGTRTLATTYYSTVTNASCVCSSSSGSVCCTSTCQTNYNGPTNTTTAYVIQIKKNVRTFTLQLTGSTNLGYRAYNANLELHNPNTHTTAWSDIGWQKPVMGQNTSLKSYTSSDSYINLRIGATETSPSAVGPTTLSFSYTYYDGDPVPTVKYFNIDYQAYQQNANGDWSSRYYGSFSIREYAKTNKTYDVTYTIPASSLPSGYAIRAVPNIILDSGMMVTLLQVTPSTTTYEGNPSYWEPNMFNGNRLIVQSNAMSISNGHIAFDPNQSYELTTSMYPVLRSGTVLMDQNLYIATYKFNNFAATNPGSLANGIPESASSRFLEVEFNSSFPEVIRYEPGTTRKTDFNFYSYTVLNDPTLGGNAEDLAIYTVGGTRVPLGTSKFNLLYNVTTAGTGYLQGISYSNSYNEVGTLLTPWQSIAEDAYVIVSGNICIYRDKANKWYKLSIVEDEPEISAILEDRLIVINTTSYWNCYDYITGEKFHYATDYNQRLRHGTNSTVDFRGAIYQGSGNYKAYPYIRYTGSGVNVLYQTMPRWPVLAPIYPITARYRCYVGDERLYNSIVPEDEKQYVDVFYSTQSSNNCIYKHSIHNTKVTSKFIINDDIVGLGYPGSTSTSPSLTPNIFTKYLNGAGNNDMVIEGYDSYILTYYDEQPYLVYSAATVTSNVYGQDDSFFVLQGQFYGIIGDKLYALSYNNGAIAGKDCIIDLGDLKFLGNNPMISFWWDGASRVIKSFTGDANLDTIYNASKFTDFSGRHWYDTTTQSIYADTDKGLLVFGPRNTYCLTDYIDVTNVQFSNDGVTHITHEGVTDDFVYYKQDGYKVLPVKLETSFYGIGANEYTNIDRWDITLFDYNYENPETYIKVGVRSLTDITVKSEEKTMKITPDMYDSWSHSVLIRYVPKLQKGQGIRLFLETPLTLQKIVPHMADMGTGTLTKRGL